MICKTANTRSATTPQNAGRCHRLVYSSRGTSVSEYTSPRSSSSGFGFVTSVTNTVTTTQMTQAQSAWYMACANPLATGDRANTGTHRSGLIFINVNIPDFSLPDTTITVTGAQSQTVTVNVTPLSTTPSTVTLSSAPFSLPEGMSLSFNPSTVSLNGAAVPVTLTLTTTGPSGGPAAARPAGWGCAR